MEEYSLILLIDCWTSFEGVFVNKWSYCWFPRDIMAATLDCRNKSISLHCELNLFHVNSQEKFYFIIIQHGRLVTWLQTRNPLRTPSAHIVITASILMSDPVLLF